jgi:DNA-directed RNA polymerase specialized sigma24 family protein
MDDDRDAWNGPSPRFPSTRWSLVIQAGSATSPQARQALAELCEAYWYPIYAFIRRKQNSHDDALDRTQTYFARLLEKPIFAAADQRKGRFRTFLCTDCQNFLIDEYRRRKRRGEFSCISIDGDLAESRYRIEPTHDMTPERQFDRSWAITLLDRGLRLLAEEYAAKGRAAVFDCLKCVLDQRESAVPVATLAAQLGKTEAAVYTAVHRLKRRYRKILEREVAATLDEGSSIDEEIRALFDALRP